MKTNLGQSIHVSVKIILNIRGKRKMYFIYQMIKNNEY